ncbi:hypothetical protein [Microseira sp. BLCC-F43]|uniref:hypothetical protein n=1 Tax=Microseira sp. BLCC-F43 TaxID=3153602 RepID=UPI0035BA6EEE
MSIVFEDFGGESLTSWMSNRQVNYEDFLQIAIATTASLAQIHAANIIHKNINPSNIVDKFFRETRLLRVSPK